MSLTTDPNDPLLRQHESAGTNKGQQKAYLVLSEEERAKGFVRPVRYRYVHLACGGVTTMGAALSETYARDPKFYGGTFCCNCGTHFRLQDARPGVKTQDDWAFLWEPEGDPVGSNAEEAAAFLAAKTAKETEKHKGAGI
jgi:hypothetical protein